MDKDKAVLLDIRELIESKSYCSMRNYIRSEMEKRGEALKKQEPLLLDVVRGIMQSYAPLVKQYMADQTRSWTSILAALDIYDSYRKFYSETHMEMVSVFDEVSKPSSKVLKAQDWWAYQVVVTRDKDEMLRALAGSVAHDIELGLEKIQASPELEDQASYNALGAALSVYERAMVIVDRVAGNKVQ